ncbi:hypothetical protein BDQ17DRAFT_1349954 [Cyathus striatus]|nr:hypothetical protein BDQ17DRAFT_1349954 [Cyathus striatus]
MLSIVPSLAILSFACGGFVYTKLHHLCPICHSSSHILSTVALWLNFLPSATYDPRLNTFISGQLQHDSLPSYILKGRSKDQH